MKHSIFLLFTSIKKNQWTAVEMCNSYCVVVVDVLRKIYSENIQNEK